MKHNVKSSLSKAHSRLANNLLTVALAAFAGVTSLAGVQPALAQSEDIAAKRFVHANRVPGRRYIRSIDSKYGGPVSRGSRGGQQCQQSWSRPGRREINWDGGSPTNATTTLTGTPLITFLNTRGANITTRGSGFVQAPPSGLADTFGNSSYATIFHAFSPLRLFSPIGSNVTEVEFSVPGSNGNTPATSTGFGVVFSDVDSPDGSRLRDATGNRQPAL